MEKPALSNKTLALLYSYQRCEETDYAIYRRMATREKDGKNKAILARIAAEERAHAQTWRQYTGKRAYPNRWKVLWYNILGLLLGYTFVIKLMEKNEYATGAAYRQLMDELPEAQAIIDQEQAHEEELDNMLDEERLQYVGAMVLGLNDALVELTGALAGLTFAMADTRLIALSGIITGVSATLSMAASNYLAERANGSPNALKSSIYTGVAYLVTVVFLVLPYLLFPPHLYAAALGTMLAVAILIILFFNYYIAIAKSEPFAKRFGEMAAISLGVALISFLIGLVVKRFLGIDV
ncbi:MAG: VIT1/CCC1 transporter family protein [Oscillospiraceae bacterium]